MVNFCAMIGCGNRGMRDKKSFFRLPAVIEKEGDKTRTLSEKRRNCWLAASRYASVEIYLQTGCCVVGDRANGAKLGKKWSMFGNPNHRSW